MSQCVARVHAPVDAPAVAKQKKKKKKRLEHDSYRVKKQPRNAYGGSGVTYVRYVYFSVRFKLTYRDIADVKKEHEVSAGLGEATSNVCRFFAP